MMKASVCICTYNGGARLPAVIECLARQTVPRDAWELIIVDNASKDDTAAIATTLLAQHGLTNGRVVPEPEPGFILRAPVRGERSAGGKSSVSSTTTNFRRTRFRRAGDPDF